MILTTRGLITEMAAKWLRVWAKGWFMSWAEQRGTVGDYFITLLRTVCNLKLMNCLFLEFPFNIFGPLSTTGNCNSRSAGNYCTIIDINVGENEEGPVQDLTSNILPQTVSLWPQDRGRAGSPTGSWWAESNPGGGGWLGPLMSHSCPTGVQDPQALIF